MDESVIASGVIAGVLSSVIISSLIFWVLIVIAHWKMFTKAGEAGWKSIIPIYSDYVLYKLVWNTQNFWITLALELVTAIFIGISGAYTTTVNGELVATNAGNPIFTLLSGIGGIAVLVWSVRLILKTAKAYGKGIGFGIGMIIFPNIFSLILGFGSAEYVGPQE